MTDKENTMTKSTENEAASESRRDFLKKAGAFALYAPPAITLLANPSHASVRKSPGGNRDYDGYRRPRNHNGGNRSGYSSSRGGNNRHR